MEFYFDLDGTLVDVSTRHYAVYSHIAASLGFRALGFADYWMAKRSRKKLSDILTASGAVDRVQEFTTMWLSTIERDDYLTLDSLFPSTLEVLAELRIENGVRLVTLRHSRAGLDAQLNRLKLRPLFDKVISAPAPADPAPFKAALIRQSGPAMRAWIVGDTEADVLAARILGFTACAVTSGLRSLDVLHGCRPDYVVEHIKDLPRIVSESGATANSLQ